MDKKKDIMWFLVLGGLGVAAYFLFFRRKMDTLKVPEYVPQATIKTTKTPSIIETAQEKAGKKFLTSAPGRTAFSSQEKLLSRMKLPT